MFDIDIEFKKYTKQTVDEYGYQIECIKGLWAVCGLNKDTVLREAYHYFRQYFTDGEYNDENKNL